MKILFISPTIESTGNTSTARRISKHLNEDNIKCVLCSPHEIIKNDAECNKKQLELYLKENGIDGVLFLHAFKSGKTVLCSKQECCSSAIKGKGNNELHYGVIFGGTDLNIDIHVKEKLSAIEMVLKNAKFCVAFNEGFKEIAQTMKLDGKVYVQPQAIDIGAVNKGSEGVEIACTKAAMGVKLLTATHEKLSVSKIRSECFAGAGIDPTGESNDGDHMLSYNIHTVNTNVVDKSGAKVLSLSQNDKDNLQTGDHKDYNENLLTATHEKFSASKIHSEYLFEPRSSNSKATDSSPSVEHQGSNPIYPTNEEFYVPKQYLFLMVSGIRPVKAPLFLLRAFLQWVQSTQVTQDLRLLIIGPILDEEYAKIFFENIESMKKHYREQCHYDVCALKSQMSSASQPPLQPSSSENPPKDSCQPSTNGSGRLMSCSSLPAYHFSSSLNNQEATTRRFAKMSPSSTSLPQFPPDIESWMSSSSQFPIFYSPPVGRSDLMNLMRYKVFACVNSSESEGQSTAILEAMASRVPVIARDNIGNKSLLTEGETGLLFTNPQQFVEQAEKLVTNHSLRKSITENALNTVKEKHSTEKEKMFYRQICKKYFMKSK